MKFEYLILNLLIVAGPLALSFEKKMRFVAKWRHAFPVIIVIAIPFLIWDAMVTGRHWWFNENYTLDFRVMGLPMRNVCSLLPSHSPVFSSGSHCGSITQTALSMVCALYIICSTPVHRSARCYIFKESNTPA
jgi:lycopene cyclase domain-containing protein